MTTSNDHPDHDELSFEQAVARLEDIVANLEDDRLDLEAALAAYEEGVSLARLCLRRLDAAELRIQEVRPEHEDDE